MPVQHAKVRPESSKPPWTPDAPAGKVARAAGKERANRRSVLVAATDSLPSRLRIVGDLISYQNDGKGCTAIADKVVRT
jgi:hypothetical protein